MQEELRCTLAELHARLEQIEGVDDEVRRLLEEAAGEIGAKLGDSSRAQTPASAEPMLDRLRRSARHFEASHPVLTDTLSRLADALGQMGI